MFLRVSWDNARESAFCRCRACFKSLLVPQKSKIYFRNYLDNKMYILKHILQHVSGSTHRRGHTLDLIITRKDESFLRRLSFCKTSTPTTELSRVNWTLQSHLAPKFSWPAKTIKPLMRIDEGLTPQTPWLSQLILNQDISVDTYNATLGKSECSFSTSTQNEMGNPSASF